VILTATDTSTWLWYFGRATGFVALVLLSAVVVLGILGPLRIASVAWPRYAIRTVHRDASLLALLVIAIHVIVLVLDSDVSIPIASALLPWESSYAPFWTGLGAVAFDLLIAIVISSLMRRRLGYRAWRSVHWLAYAIWPIALAHGLGAGSDSRSAWALGLRIACVTAIAIAVAMRLQYGAAAKTLEV
jgi:sulfoxide reductase heme-binding subunit YedZ